MDAKKYLESIGLEKVIDEEFFNDDDKSWYKVQGLMESYHQSKISNSENTGSDSAVTSESCDYTNVSHRTAHGDGSKAAVESALASTAQDGNIRNCPDCGEKLYESYIGLACINGDCLNEAIFDMES